MAAAVVETVHAPPAMTFLHEEQFQIPTAVLLTESYITGSSTPITSKSNEAGTHLATECAGITGMLRDFHLFDLLTQRSTITLYRAVTVRVIHPLQTNRSNLKTHSTVLARDSDLLCTLCLQRSSIHDKSNDDKNSDHLEECFEGVGRFGADWTIIWSIA